MKKAIFLDRDGTLNEDTGYPHQIADYALLPGVVEGLKLLKEHYELFIVTNQSGIAKGIFEEEDLNKFNLHLLRDLESHDIEIKDIFICTHQASDNCNCRKPNPTSLLDAKREYKINLKQSWVIGDRPSDIELAKKAKAKSVFLLTGYGAHHYANLKKKRLKPDHVAMHFKNAAEYILKHDEKINSKNKNG